MDVLTSSWLVLTKEWSTILSLLGIFLLGGIILFLWFKTLFNNSLTLGEYFVLSLGGTLFPLSLAVLLTLLLNFFFGVKASFLVFFFLIFVLSCLSVYLISKKNQCQTSDSSPFSKQAASSFISQQQGIISLLVLILLFFGSLYIRLAFISGLITPLYFDSENHYAIIQGLVSKIETSSLATIESLVSGYYHLGYHAIIASISLAFDIDIKEVMLIFGQILLAVIPLPMFFMIRQETEMDAPAFFAILLAGWGWSMPAFATNWGKYPALTSILTFELVLCNIYLLMRSPKRYRWVLIGFTGFCLLVSTFIHSRSLILITLAVISGSLGMVWRRLPKLPRAVILGFIGIAIIALIYVIQSKPVLSLAFLPYRGDGLWMVSLVLLLFPFALYKFPTATFSASLLTLLLLVGLFIPINQIVPGHDVQTLLDRPYTEMLLFFPLAFLSGLGYAGLVKTLGDFRALQEIRPIWVNSVVALLLFGAIALNTTHYKFSPSECCQFFGEDDAVAIDWMNKNLPTDAKIGISSTQSFVLESQSTGTPGNDAGVWITPLIHRDVFYLSDQVSFRDQSTLDNLCKNTINYIYVGSTEQSFSLLQLQDRPTWYEMLLLLPKAQVFKVIGCQ